MTAHIHSAQAKNMANTNSSDAFRFLDLPPELRNVVYSLVFATHEDTNTIQLSDREFGRFWVADRGEKVASSHPGTGDGTVLARVSKQFAAETTPMLYGDTTFHFADLCVLDRFLESIGDNVKHVTSIHVHDRIPDGQRTTFSTLSRAIGLRKLTLSYRVLGADVWYETDGVVSPRRLVSVLAPVLHARRCDALKKAGGDLRKVLEMVEVRKEEACRACAEVLRQPCSRWLQEGRGRCDATSMGPYAADMSSRINRLIERELALGSE